MASERFIDVTPVDGLTPTGVTPFSEQTLEEQVRTLKALVVQQESKIASILEISNALRATRSEDELLHLIMEKISLLMDADRSTLFLKDEDADELWSKIREGTRTIEIRLALGEGIAGWVAQTGQSINIKDAYRDPRFNPDIDFRTGYRTRSVLCQPMRNQDRRIIGVIQVLNKRHGYFSVDDELLLSAIAAQAATVIENSALYHSVLEANYELNEIREALEKKIAEQDLLVEIQREFGRALNIDELLTAIGERVLGIIPSQLCAFLLEEPEGHHLYAVFRPQGEDTDYHLHKARAESTDQEARTHVLGEGIPYLCNSPHQCPTYPELARRGVDCKTVVSVPLVAEEQVFGCIEMINKRGVGSDGGPAQYSDTELKFLSLLAGQIAPGVATYLFRARKEREDRLSAIGQMLSGVLHDFKTPATIISGYVQLMARTDDPDLRAEYAESIKKQFDQLNQMTGEILSFARGESTILLRKVYLNRFMDDVHELLNQELKSRNIDLVLDVQYRRTAKFDEGKLKRAIFNVARNAIEAMRDGGTFRVTVTANEPKNQLIFRLSDTGVGIPEDIRDRLFESFVTHGKKAGTGLGLAIVKKIVEEHDGEIDFETAPDKGTTFEIRLPLDP